MEPKIEYRVVENIDEAKGNADDFVCTEGGSIRTAIVMLGWDELDMLESYFDNPVWMECVQV